MSINLLLIKFFLLLTLLGRERARKRGLRMQQINYAQILKKCIFLMRVLSSDVKFG